MATLLRKIKSYIITSEQNIILRNVLMNFIVSFFQFYR